MKTKKKLLSVLLAAAVLLGSPSTAYAQNTTTYHYTYDFWSLVNKSLPAFELVRTVEEDAFEVTVTGIDDIATGGNRIFLIDTKESRMNVLNVDYEYVFSVKLLKNQDGKIVTDPDTGNQLVLTNPEGVWFHEYENEIYIADTGASRIVVLDGDGYYLKRIIEKPDNMIGVTQFNPSKIVVSHANKIYAVVQGGFEGIVELDYSGRFSRYFGVNKPVVDLWDYFWKSISSDEQKMKMAKTYAPSFNNVALDQEGFLFATTIDGAAEKMVFRMNPKGENVLRESGYVGVYGDEPSASQGYVSQFVDVAVTDYGVYALLDQAKGRIFLYDFDGNLINIFSSSGDLKGNFKAPSGIAWFGDALLAVDKNLKCMYVYEMTEFGASAIGAARSYYKGDWEDSAAFSREAIRLNANYDLAYVDLGKYYLMADDYKTAMYYFKLGNNKEFYSKAYNGYRNLWVQKNFVWILAGILAGTSLLVYSEIRYQKRKA